MNIQSINKNLQNYNTNFKSAYPVVHWVRETNGSFAPVVSTELSEKLQKVIVRFLNNQGKNIRVDKIAASKRVKEVVRASDKDYAALPSARSFYNREGGWLDGKFEPIGYVLTGQHAETMNENLGKPIGKAKGQTPRVNDKLKYSAEVNLALGDYLQQGLQIVKKLFSNFKPDGGNGKVLHTKFEAIRTKTGKIKEFRFLDAKFCPDGGADDPFVKTGYISLNK